MNNSKHFTTPEQKCRYQKRFLTLCFEAIRQSGQCSYPPLIELFEQYEAQRRIAPSPLHGINVHELKQQVASSQDLIVGVIQYLQSLKAWDCSSQIQQAVQVMDKETKILENLLQPLCQEAELFTRLHYLQDYLLQKLSDTHFLSPQGLRVEQPMIFLQQHRRIHKYLAQLQATVSEIIESLNYQISNSRDN